MDRGKIVVICIILLFTVPMFAGLLLKDKSDNTTNEDQSLKIAIAKCANEGNKYEIVGTSAVCILEDGTRCEIYQYYNGLCGGIV